LKAADAQTLSGLPASAFMLAAPGAPDAQASESAASSGVGSAPTVGGSGTENYLPLWTDSNGDLGNSILYQSGSGSSAKIGINETKPLFTLDVNGQELVRGLLEVATTGYANKNRGYNSQPFNLESSAFNSGTSTYTLNHFQWQAEPAGNNTSTPSATLNLLYGTDPAAPSETGLSLSSKGLFTFAPGQAFPGTGTVTSVGSGAGLTGGPITGSGTLSIASAGVTNAMLQNPSLTVSAGTDLTGGGAVFLGGTTTLNVDTTKVPQLNAANTFTGNQTVNGNLTASGVITGNSYQIGSNLFAFGSYTNQNAFLGFAGNSTTTGTFDTATGWQSLLNNTNGLYNVANGTEALQFNTSGSGNTAVGNEALQANNVGGYNTASGAYALLENTTGSQNTASGYQALYANKTSADNTAEGYQALHYNLASGITAVGSQALMNNSTGTGNTATGFQALYSNTTALKNTADGYQALYSDATNGGNTAAGFQALYSTVASANNTADGVLALHADTTGSNNVAVGAIALYSNIGGSGNTAVGGSALYSNFFSDGNTGVGNTALYSVEGSYNTGVGASAAGNNQSGQGNTGVGFQALYASTSGDYLTCIGYQCSADAGYNATAVGAFATVGESNALVLGGTGDHAVKVGIGTSTPSNILTIRRGAGHPVSDSWETYSSRRWKTNIKVLPDALAKVERLRGVSYDLKDSGKHEIGVIAEEVGAVVPEVVSYDANGKDASGVDYSRLTALLIEAVKQQQVQIARQAKQIAAQHEQIRRLRSKDTVLESKLTQLQRNIDQRKQIRTPISQLARNQAVSGTARF
ncbi:MAG: tail fiber domain-containing protein, partial [Terriglobales bacterium]